MIETTDTRILSFAHDGKICAACGRPIAKPAGVLKPQVWGRRKWCSHRCKSRMAMRRYLRRRAS